MATPNIDYNDIFDFVAEKDKKDRTIYRILWKHTGLPLHNGMAMSRERAEGIAFNWVHNPKNEKLVLDMVAELTLLGKE